MCGVYVCVNVCVIIWRIWAEILIFNLLIMQKTIQVRMYLLVNFSAWKYTFVILQKKFC